MFETRLRALLIVLGAVGVVLLARLGQLQLVQADYYRERAEQSLILRPASTPFVRGGILDRTGLVLVRDEPSWEIALDFDLIAADVGQDADEALKLARSGRRAGRYAEAKDDDQAVAALWEEVAMWRDLAWFQSDVEPTSVEGLRDRARSSYDRLVRIRRTVAARRGFDAPVAEELVPQRIITDLNAGRQISARERFERYSWVHVRPASVRRVLGAGEPFAHLLGRLARVDADDVDSDPNADDPFARYRADEVRGATGVEWAAEQTLRGRRGQITRDRAGDLVSDGCIEAQDGADVVLTLHAGLQRRMYQLLGEVVDAAPDSSGGAIVVLDVRSREVLAMTSYPSFDPNRFDESYSILRDDTDRLPLRFRAVANAYAPASTLKPLACLAGLMSGRIDLNTHETCTGYLFDDHRDRWRCWEVHGTDQRKAHGSIDVVGALRGSCNVFMFRLGDRLGVDGLCSAFDMAGLGKRTGIGLREEAAGVNPTPGWLMREKGSPVYPGHARNFSIGQGEVLMTPVQVANLMAIYASGRLRPVTLIRDGKETPEWSLPATPEQWLAIRRGIYDVVNDPEGTAYRFARLVDDRYALCGKTGSATAYRWPTAYRVPFVDENGVDDVAIVRAGAVGPAMARFMAEHPGVTFEPELIQVASRWPPQPPPPDDRYSHAWFGGILQPLDGTGRPDWTQEAPIAFAALVEFGGSGGRTTGPLGKRIAEALIERLGPTLSPDDQAAKDVPP